MSEKWTPGPWRVTEKLGLYVTVGSMGHIVASLPVRSAENDANARLIALAPRMAEALAACNRYFEACARAWAADEGRVLNAEGHAIVAAEGLDRLSDMAGELVGRVWAEIAPLTGPASDRTTSNTDESKTDS